MGGVHGTHEQEINEMKWTKTHTVLWEIQQEGTTW